MALISENNASILVVHDGEELTGIIARFLRHEGYKVLEAQNPAEAVAIAKSGVAIDVLMAQYDLPGLNGVKLGSKIRTVRPTLPMVFLTGDLDAGESIVGNGFIWLRKPLLFAELTATLTTALGQPFSPKPAGPIW